MSSTNNNTFSTPEIIEVTTTVPATPKKQYIATATNKSPSTPKIRISRIIPRQFF
jgi:hypothetical protein